MFALIDSLVQRWFRKLRTLVYAPLHEGKKSASFIMRLASIMSASISLNFATNALRSARTWSRPAATLMLLMRRPASRRRVSSVVGDDSFFWSPVGDRFAFGL